MMTIGSNSGTGVGNGRVYVDAVWLRWRQFGLAMASNLDQALLAGTNDKVKMTCQVKFSADFQNDPDLKGTRRFILEDKNKDGDVDEETVLDVSLPLYDPANLAEFIQWSKRTLPGSKLHLNSLESWWWLESH